MEKTETSTALGILLPPVSSKAIWSQEEIQEVYSRFLMREMFYSGRNENMDIRDDFFEGLHWEVEDAEEERDRYRLVFNYVRRTILARAAGLAKAPEVRVRVTSLPKTEEFRKAAIREKFLRVLWPSLMEAWESVEMNSSKYSYGVLEIKWGSQGKTKGAEGHRYREVLEPPFKFGSLPPKHFYPIYRSHTELNDMSAVFVSRPGQLIADLELKYGIPLQGSSAYELSKSLGPGWVTIGTEETTDVVEYWTETRFIIFARTSVLVKSIMEHDGNRIGDTRRVEGIVILAEGKNPFNKIPFWVVPNIRSNPNADATNGGCISDAEDIYFINQHYNHMISEEAEEVSTVIHNPIIYSSDEHMQDPNTLTIKPGAVWPIGDEEKIEALKLGNVSPLVESHFNKLQDAMKDLTFMGDAAMGKSDSQTSGVAAQIALTPQKQYLELKLPIRKRILMEVCAFLFESFETIGEKLNIKYRTWLRNSLGMFGKETITAEDIGGLYFSEIKYGNLLPRNDYEHDQNESFRFKTGAQSLYTTVERMGHPDPSDEVDRIKEEAQDDILNPDRVIQTSQAKMSSANEDGGPPTAPGQQDQQGPPGMQGPPQAPPQSPQFGGPPQAPPGGGQPGVGPSMQAAPSVPPSPVHASNQTAPPQSAGPAAPYTPRDKAPNIPRRRPGMHGR